MGIVVIGNGVAVKKLKKLWCCAHSYVRAHMHARTQTNSTSRPPNVGDVSIEHYLELMFSPDSKTCRGHWQNAQNPQQATLTRQCATMRDHRLHCALSNANRTASNAHRVPNSMWITL